MSSHREEDFYVAAHERSFARPGARRRSRKDPDPDWKKFELAVHKTLQLLGYGVEHNTSLANCQIDVYAEREFPLFVHRLIVECKRLSSAAGVDVVRELFSIVKTVSSNAAPVHGLLVCDKGFTADAKGFAQQCGITLRTLPELQFEVFDPDPIVRYAIDSFEADNLSNTYIPLSCAISESKSGTIYKPVEKFLDDFFKRTKKPGVAVLGNFGSGKTSLCKHYAYQLAKRWNREDPGSLLPIYVNLRDLDSLSNLEREVRTILESQYGVTASEKGLRNWLEFGQTLIILDGFDEMASRLSRPEVHRSLENLRSVSMRLPVKLMVTCRTHFFKTALDESELKDFVRLYVLDWGVDELKSYVQKASEQPEDTLFKINTTYNLTELARTPIFLQMVTETIGNIKGRVNVGKLYQYYTDNWIRSQAARSNLEFADVQRFMEELAFHIYITSAKTKSSKIVVDQLPLHLSRILKIVDRAALMKFDQDIRTCTFLVRDEDKSYHYSHKSFQEFFIGLKLAQEVKNGNTKDFSKIELTREIAMFFACFFESDALAPIGLLDKRKPPTCRQNGATILAFLPSSASAETALIDLLKSDPNTSVRLAAAESALTLHSEAGRDMTLNLARRPDFLGYRCIALLGPFGAHKDVASFLQETLLRSGDVGQVCSVLDVLSRHRMPSMRDVFEKFVRVLDWKSSAQVIERSLTVLEALADEELVIASIGLLRQAENDPITAKHVAELSVKLQSKISARVQLTARELHDAGLSYKETEGKLWGTFKPCLDAKLVTRTLRQIYATNLPPVKGRRKEWDQRKRGEALARPEDDDN